MLEIFNGIADAREWTCQGYRFVRVAEYHAQLERLPDLPSAPPGGTPIERKGEHVVTFHAYEPDRSPGKSRIYEDGTALHDILTLWTFGGRHEVGTANSNMHGPSIGEKTFALSQPDDIVGLISEGYERIRRLQDRRIRSALLTYLEIAHVRPLQVKVALITSVFECLTSLRHVPRDPNSRSAKYAPIIQSIASMEQIKQIPMEYDFIAELIIELYKMRNAFLHSGVEPYRNNIQILGITTSMGRIVMTARYIAKLAVASAIGFPLTSKQIKSVIARLSYFLNHGSFMAIPS